MAMNRIRLAPPGQPQPGLVQPGQPQPVLPIPFRTPDFHQNAFLPHGGAQLLQVPPIPIPHPPQAIPPNVVADRRFATNVTWSVMRNRTMNINFSNCAISITRNPKTGMGLGFYLYTRPTVQLQQGPAGMDDFFFVPSHSFVVPTLAIPPALAIQNNFNVPVGHNLAGHSFLTPSWLIIEEVLSQVNDVVKWHNERFYEDFYGNVQAGPIITAGRKYINDKF